MPQQHADFAARLGHADHPGLLPWVQRLEAIAPGANPYVTGDALPGNSPVFAGRGDRLHQVLAHLRRADKPGSVSVLGERRMGKSSFLRQVVEALAAEPGLITVYATSQGWDGAAEQAFFARLHHAIAAVTPGLPDARVEDWSAFQGFIAQAARNHRFVLVIDEFERLTDNSHFDSRFFAHLRCLGNEPEYRCGFLTASARPLKELCDGGGIAESKFWNIFSTYTLGLLDRQAAAALAREPLQRCLGKAAQPPEALTALAGAHPFFLQKVLHGHVDAISHGYSLDRDALRLDLHQYLAQLWQVRDAEERVVLLRIAGGYEVEDDVTLLDLRQRGLVTEDGTLCCAAFRIAISGFLPRGRTIKAVLDDLEAGGEKADKVFDWLSDESAHAFKGSELDASGNSATENHPPLLSLDYLCMEGIGPAQKMELHLAPRFNVITGDNGLGKSFLLDVVWWVLTDTWSGFPAQPRSNNANSATITSNFISDNRNQPLTFLSHFDQQRQTWFTANKHSLYAGLVIYANADGGFSIWDPVRNAPVRKLMNTEPDRLNAYLFKRDDIWNGLDKDGQHFCNGMIADWSGWQKEQSESFRQLELVLKQLSPCTEELLVPGKLTRIAIDDVRDMPTLRLPYGQDVPILQVSSGIKRILALAYLLIWSWQEHKHACDMVGQAPVRQITFLIDEVEAHLHPRWQRRVLHALIEVMGSLKEVNVHTQIITSTHSPLILSSLEPLFDTEKDRLFDLDMKTERKTEGKNIPEVLLREVSWRLHGEADNWLTSEVFGLRTGRSIEAEKAIEEAAALLTQGKDMIDSVQAKIIHERLQKLLSDTDSFWLRWRFLGEKQGWLS